MTEELKEYLEKTKDKRNNLTKLANNFKNNIENISTELTSLKNISDFPNFNPQRFRIFKDNLEKEVKGMYYSNINAREQIDTKRSLSLNRKNVASVYNFSKPIPKRCSVLPPILREKRSSILERVLGGKYEIDDEHSKTTTASTKATVKCINSRFEAKKDLLIPILKKKNSKAFVN